MHHALRLATQPAATGTPIGIARSIRPHRARRTDRRGVRAPVRGGDEPEETNACTPGRAQGSPSVTLFDNFCDFLAR